MPGTAYVSPYTYVPLEVLTAAKLNAMQDNLRALKAWSTAGDLLYAYDSDQLERLPIGTDDQILSVVSGLPAWKSLSIINKRKGGSATNWEYQGSNNYDVGNMLAQAGADQAIFASNYTKSVTITFPIAFSSNPLVFVTMQDIGLLGNYLGHYAYATSTYVTVYITMDTAHTGNLSFNWLAIGPA